jgi:hypothetical protein
MSLSIRVAGAIWFAVFAFAVQGLTPSAFAQSHLCLNCDDRAELDVLFFGGVFTATSFPGWTNIPIDALEDNYIVGAAVNRQFVDLGRGFHLGGEIGLAGRFGDGTSAEVWAGPSLRYDGFRLGPVAVSFGLVVAMSAVTGPIGKERKVAAAQSGHGALLWYLGPEFSLTFDAFPTTEFVFRLHHRSGGLKVPFLPTLGNMPDVSNAYVFGIRKPL